MLRTTTAHALHEEGHQLILRTPVRHYLVRAATLGLLLPVLFAILTGLVALLELLEVGEPGLLTMGAGIFGAACSAVAVPFAAGMAVMAPRLSARSQVVIDQAARVLHPWDGEPVPLDAVVGLSLRKPNPMLKWLVIEADLAAPPSTDPSPYRVPAVRSVALVSRINELEAEAARLLMADIGRRLDLETADRTSSFLGGGGLTGRAAGRGAHALAYIPVQGIFLFASLFLLVSRRGDPRAMFHAKQSLLLLAVEMVVIVGSVAVSIPLFVVGEAMGAEPPLHPGIIGLLGTLIPVMLLRVVARFYAAWRAWHGDLWLVPLVGRVSKRWLPATD